MIPYGRQSLDDADVAAVVRVLRGDWLTQGPNVRDFEDSLANVTGARYAVAFTSGTAGLHAAAAAAELGPGDRVLTSPLSFTASANCGRYVGADVGFVDIDPCTLNMDLSAIPSGTDAVVMVHYAGLPNHLSEMAHRPRVVIEDAAHSLGAIGPNGPVGNCAKSDLCVFSFHPVKAITTGEGGAVTTNSPELAERLRRFRHHGISRLPEDAEWYYDVSELGFNYRLSDIHAALGTSQLRKLDKFIARRNELAERYHQALCELPIELPPAAPPRERHAYHLYPIRVRDRASVFAALRRAGVGAQVHYVPIHWFSTYEKLGYARGSFPAAEAAYERLLSIPMYPALTDAQQDEVVGALRRALKG